ncbi:MAG TPA: hypothetical protein VFQ38_18130 [Longimicrobiales bacterium]|nr:hypothetical protein [Longimicrobiales bacterium]
MSRTFQDENFYLWEAFPSTGAFGYPDGPSVVFNCLTNRMLRPRYVEMPGSEPEAERALNGLSEPELLELLRKARPLA